ncbi:MAG TPA: alpha/beta hydrolase [Thermosynechococcaceae cyanobacterium]
MAIPDILWLSCSPSLKRFDQPLLRILSQHFTVARWDYSQTLDEASSLNTAIVLLHDYLKHRKQPIHLVGHGIGGVVGLLYARQHPERVRSLTLLAVAAQPAATWHAHYYVQRQLLPCSRPQLLAQTARSLFGCPLPYSAKDLAIALSKDLETSPTPHSLLGLGSLPKGGVAVPLLVCGSLTDPVVDSLALQDWQAFLKPIDQLWQCDQGHHFFHYSCADRVGAAVMDFHHASTPALPISVSL